MYFSNFYIFFVRIADNGMHLLKVFIGNGHSSVADLGGERGGGGVSSTLLLMLFFQPFLKLYLFIYLFIVFWEVGGWGWGAALPVI